MGGTPPKRCETTGRKLVGAGVEIASSGEHLRSAVDASIAAQRRKNRRAEGQLRGDKKLHKGLFETGEGAQGRFDEGARKNLAAVPGGSNKELLDSDLPLSIANIQATEEQILAIVDCLDIAQRVPDACSENHLLEFASSCTEAVVSTEMPLEQAVAVFQAVKASIRGRSVNVNRLGERYGQLDSELQRQLAIL